MNSRSTEPAAGREAMLIAALALPAMLLRAAQLLEQDGGLVVTDLRGFTADAATGALAALAVALLLSLRRWLGLTAAIAWVLAAYANYEHVRALGSLTNLAHGSYLVDPTFFFGSALAPARPGLLAAALTLALALVLGATRAPGASPRILRLAGIGLLACALLGLWPLSDASEGWRQRHFAVSNALALFRGELSPEAVPGAEREVGDLAGTPRIELPKPGRNVMLVILEGVSGAHVASLRESQGAQSPIRMPALDAIAERGLSWSSFVSLQRQTNRGEYALLCGDTPKLVAGTPKMTELTGTGALDCLPARLRDAGYTTVYLQGAPLPFMLKDQFMAQAGFDAVHGDEWFEHSYARTHWGNDDRAFFEGSLEMVRSLEEQPQPWLLTLMTVGTHHPFTVPDDFESEQERGSFGWAADYLDRSLGAFVRALEAEGVLDDTLVLVTSDESSGLQHTADDVTKTLGQAWGLLIALTPEGDRGLVEETALQSDLALSVLDYLGALGDEAAPNGFSGRSVFRRYDTPRTFAFGNAYRRVLGGVNEAGELFVCNESASSCRKYAPSRGRLFSPSREERALRPGEASFVKAKAIASLRSPSALPRLREYDLIAQPEIQLVSTPNMQLVFSGQGLSSNRGDRLEVELDLELLPGAGSSSSTSRVWMAHDLISGEEKRRHYLRQLNGLRVGERVVIRYRVVTAAPLEGIESRLRIHRFQGPAPLLRVHAARLRIVPGDADPEAAGTVEEVFEIVEAG